MQSKKISNGNPILQSNLGSKFKNNAKNRKKPPTYLTSSISERANSEKLRFFFILFFSTNKFF